jgi:hypothetical protein
MNHHDGISAAIIGQLNYLSQQAESGIAVNTALLPSTQRKREYGCKARKKYLSNFLLCVIMEAFPTTPVPPSPIPPAVQQVITMLASAYKPPLCAIFHGDLLPFPVSPPSFLPLFLLPLL